MADPIVSALENKLFAFNESLNCDPNYYAQGILNPQDFSVEVNHIGKLDFPLNVESIQKLLSISTEAKFGFREQTLLDKSVRNTQEISLDQLKITPNEKVFNGILNEVREKMGLPESSRFSAHLHNMLIYQEEQFFKLHQDSEKLENMIATMVIVLPSSHIGGDLMINHHNQGVTFSSQNINEENLKWIAFYADCEHEVTRVAKGYRVALTYNLTIKSDSLINKKEIENHYHPALIQATKEYFNQGSKENDLKSEYWKPNKLVYFLDHSYTEHSLRWNSLKGNDYKNAMLFLNTAEKLDLIPYLTLVEIHESWSAEDTNDHYYHYDDDDYDEDDDDNIETKQPIDLIDDEINLDFWVNQENKPVDFNVESVPNKQIFWTKKSDEDDLIDTEYEGWTGNAGATLDYWYRRAAIVLWQKSDDLLMQFKLNYKSTANASKK